MSRTTPSGVGQSAAIGHCSGGGFPFKAGSRRRRMAIMSTSATAMGPPVSSTSPLPHRRTRDGGTCPCQSIRRHKRGHRADNRERLQATTARRPRLLARRRCQTQGFPCTRGRNGGEGTPRMAQAPRPSSTTRRVQYLGRCADVCVAVGDLAAADADRFFSPTRGLGQRRVCASRSSNSDVGLCKVPGPDPSRTSLPMLSDDRLLGSVRHH